MEQPSRRHFLSSMPIRWQTSGIHKLSTVVIRGRVLESAELARLKKMKAPSPCSNPRFKVAPPVFEK
jgi:hypothetical protein